MPIFYICQNVKMFCTYQCVSVVKYFWWLNSKLHQRVIQTLNDELHAESISDQDLIAPF